MFALLDRLDRCFHALITRSVGGGGGAGLNMTEKVRLKSLVERTRLHVVKLLDTGTGDGEWAALDVPTESEGHVQFRGGDWDGAPPTPATTTATETDTETDDDMDVDEENEEEDLEWEIQVSRVYDRYVAPFDRPWNVEECVNVERWWQDSAGNWRRLDLCYFVNLIPRLYTFASNPNSIS